MRHRVPRLSGASEGPVGGSVVLRVVISVVRACSGPGISLPFPRTSFRALRSQDKKNPSICLKVCCACFRQYHISTGVMVLVYRGGMGRGGDEVVPRLTVSTTMSQLKGFTPDDLTPECRCVPDCVLESSRSHAATNFPCLLPPATSHLSPRWEVESTQPRTTAASPGPGGACPRVPAPTVKRLL